jgi:hypothetical protein
MARTVSSPTRPRDPLARFEQDAGDRYEDLRIVVVRDATSEILFAVGARWDRAKGEYFGQAQRCKIIRLNEAQCLGEEGNNLEEGPALEIKRWFEARQRGDERLGEIVLDGARGSGKSVLGVIAVFCIAVAFPGARCLLVSPANTRRHELEVIVKDFIPPRWRAWSERDMTYTLPNGSTITYLGADDEDALKQGGFEVALLNEAQLMTSRAYVNATGGLRNLSGRPMGVLILAMNYASKERGEWTNDHLDKIEAGLRGAKHHKLDPALNGFVDENANDIAAGLARSVSPELADIDFSGIRKLLGNMAAPMFKPARIEFGGHVGKPPADWVEVTRHVTALKTGYDKGYARVIGADFQRRPGCVAVVFRLFRKPGSDALVYWAERYIEARNGYEDELAMAIDEYLNGIGLTARDALVVADSTGRHQDALHQKGTKPSHQILREYYFTVVSPMRKLKQGGWGIGNPDVDDSVAQFNCVLMDDCFYVSDEADPNEFLITSLRKCKTKKRGGSIRLDDRPPGYSHPVDCGRYVTYYFEPRRGPSVPDGGFNRAAFDALAGTRLGFGS